MRVLTNQLFYILVFVLAGLIACNDEPKNKVTNLDQIRPKASVTQKQISPKNTVDTLAVFLKTYANDSCQLKMSAIYQDSTQNKHFLNRFSMEHFHVICCDSAKKIYGHQEWSFKDSNQAKEAFFNWIDQFESQKPFKIGAKENIFKQYTLIVLSPKKIVQVSANHNFNFKEWLRLLSANFKNAPLNYVIWAQPKRNTKWYQYKNAQLLTL